MSGGSIVLGLFVSCTAVCLVVAIIAGITQSLFGTDIAAIFGGIGLISFVVSVLIGDGVH
jgi:hypothetical protein